MMLYLVQGNSDLDMYNMDDEEIDWEEEQFEDEEFHSDTDFNIN